MRSFSRRLVIVRVTDRGASSGGRVPWGWPTTIVIEARYTGSLVARIATATAIVSAGFQGF
jgi:hypothetical protein